MTRCLVCFNLLAYCSCNEGHARRHGEAKPPRWHTGAIALPPYLANAMAVVAMAEEPPHCCRYEHFAASAAMN